MEKRLFTSECVTNGHPDKVADSISDAILDACLAQDANSRVACETMVTTDFCLICGEITTKAEVDYKEVAREAIRKIGYVYPGDGFDADSVEILCTHYGKIGGLWFDGNWSKPDADWKLDDLYGTIRKYQPEAMIINNTGLHAKGVLCAVCEKKKG